MKAVDSPSVTTDARRGPSGSRALRSGDVALAVIDYGFDLCHPALRDTDGSSRLAVLHDQNSGRTFNAAALDDMAAGAPDRAYAAYDPHANYYDATGGRHGAHGTMMAALAGQGAQDARLIAIQLALAEADWREIDPSGQPSWLAWMPEAEPVWGGWRSYLASTRFTAALDLAYETALERGDAALVINLSLGTWAGAHDGRSAVEQKIAALTAGAHGDIGPVVAVVVPAGNAGADRGHYSAIVGHGAPVSLTWQVGTGALGPHKLELWSDGAVPPKVEVTLPGADAPVPVRIGATADLRLAGQRVGVGATIARASGPLSLVRLSVSFAHVAMGPTAEVPVLVRISTDSGPPARVHAWIERSGDGRPHSWLTPADPLSTLGGLATAPGAIVVGASDTTTGRGRPFELSGRGPHPWTGATLPHIVRPGHLIRVPRSKSAGTTKTSGTSAAAALASADLVQCLAEARCAALARGQPVRPAIRSAISAFTGAVRPSVPVDLPSATRQEHPGP